VLRAAARKCSGPAETSKRCGAQLFAFSLGGFEA
jgi:hypothetical protein